MNSRWLLTRVFLAEDGRQKAESSGKITLSLKEITDSECRAMGG
ncbi:MAG: hypothetical protein PHP26_00020 [Syntrophomonas sp.]|nr:hypothetical protein [Syntrophomonas sp.]